MSQSDKLKLEKMMAELFSQPEPQVPPGNPIADYFAQQSGAARKVSGPAAGLAALTAPVALYNAANPAISLPFGALAAGGLLVNGYYEDTAKKADKGAKMWSDTSKRGPAYRGGK